MANITIAFSKDIETVKGYVAEGYCPVECSFGGVSVVDELELDHHGEKSGLESVAIRAYRDFFGARAEDPRFVINHIDADCVFAVASLAGLLPHPSQADKVKPFQVKTWTQDLLPLAETIALIDTDPIGRDVLSMPMGDILTTWNALFSANADDELAAYAGVEGWRRLLTQPSTQVFVSAAEEAEKQRQISALADLKERSEKVGDVLVLRQSRMFGFDVWYQRRPESGAPTEARGWANPVVVSCEEGADKITVACPNQKVAEELLGEGGLRGVFRELNAHYDLPDASGFGGREAIGGSPRGQKMTEDDLLVVIAIIQRMMK